MYADADAVLGLLLRGIALDNAPGNEVELLQRTLLSRPNLEQVVARTSLDMRVNSASSREALLAKLATEIRLTPQTRNLFRVEYTDRDPRLARDVVQTVLTLFTEAVAGTDRQQMGSAQAFLQQQIASYEVRLREAERRRAEFQARYVDLLPDANGGASRLEGARGRLQQLRGTLVDARNRRDLTRQQLDAAPEMVVVGTEGGGGGGGGGGGRVAELERNLRELRLRYTDAHPDVIAARNALASVRASGAGGGTAPTPVRNVMRPNPIREQMQVRLVDAEANVASLERQVKDAEAELERLDGMARDAPEVQAQFTNLDRDYNVLRRNYEELLARRESIQIAEAARTGSDRVKLEVVDPPSIPNNPVAPNRPLLLTAVLAAGLGSGGALALLLAQLDAGFYTIQDLRKLELPVLGRLSAMRRRLMPRLLSATAFATACTLLLMTFGAVLVGRDALTRIPAFLMRNFA